jgi:hypothetical protein
MDKMMLLEIQDKVLKDEYEFSKHAVDQSIQRNIRVEEIRQAFLSGEIIEDYPEDKYGPSCLILGYTKNDRPIHIHCSYPARIILKVITVYEPNSVDWIDYKIRRR